MTNNSRKLNAAIVGLGFGAEFIPIYQHHPNVHLSGICRRDTHRLHELADAFQIEKRFVKFDDLLADPAIDFVHVTAHVWRFLYDSARQYRESFDVYGSKKSFEWSLVEGESHVIHTAKLPEPEIPQKIEIPDFASRLPVEIRPFTQSIVDADHLSFLQGAGHGGSHPHLIHEFVSSLLAHRDPWPNATMSANWTCVGILAHDSALQGGKRIWLPEFTRSASILRVDAADGQAPHSRRLPSSAGSRTALFPE